MTRIVLPLLQALLLSGSATALSTPSVKSSATRQPGKWSETAIETANQITINARQRLYDEGVMDLKFDRPIRIKGKPISEETEEKEESSKKDEAVAENKESTEAEEEESKEKEPVAKEEKPKTKILHFQRHGQGFHNVLCAQWNELTGGPVNLESHDPSQNPMLRDAVLDAPLSEQGRQECLSCRDEASALNPELIIVSPLTRAIESARLTWSAHRQKEELPWMAHEDCREELGMLLCNKRRPISEKEMDYPDIDFSFCEDDQDTLFIPGRAESPLEKTGRVYDFLMFVRDLPHDEIAVVGHSAWLFNMCNAVMDIEDEALKSWFLTSEIRSMEVSFEDPPEVTP